jgi:signal transduction histidine kinase
LPSKRQPILELEMGGSGLVSGALEISSEWIVIAFVSRIRPASSMLAALLALSLAWSPARAQDRLIRRYGEADGLRVGSVQRLAQDSTGFLWIGGVGGLRRWDGREMRHWAPDRLDNRILSMTVCPDGKLYVIKQGGVLFEVTARSAAAVRGPGPGGVTSARSVTCDADGRVWIATDDGVLARDPAGRWRTAWQTSLSGLNAFFPEAPGGPGAWLSTAHGLWHIAPDGARILVAAVPTVVSVVQLPAGDTLILTAFDGLYRVQGGSRTRVMRNPGRGISMVARGRAAWVAFDRWLAVLRPDAPPELIDSSLIPEGGGPLLVDREGSLWVGTFSGLLQFPEPATTYWNDRHGLRSPHTRFVARQGARTWISAWQGLGFVERRDGVWHAQKSPPAWNTTRVLHVDARGTLWIPTDRRLLEVAGNRLLRARPLPSGASDEWDMDDVPGGVWLSSDRGLLFAPLDGGAVLPVRNSPFPPGAQVRQALLARDGRVWLASEEEICGSQEPIATDAGGSFAAFDRGTAWGCDSVPGAVELTGLVDMPSGAIWAASSRLGVLTRRDGGWRPLAGNAQLTARAVYHLVPSRDGTVWVLGFAVPVRVRERTDLPAGWEVVEAISAWQGVASEALDGVEDDDGTLWFATSLGLARVPPEARHSERSPPPVALVDVRVDDASADVDAVPRVPYGHNRVNVRWAALSYRDPSLIRYQVRLAPDQQWVDQQGPPSFGWIDLPDGHYTAEVRASLDGRTWTAEPASFSWTVLAPWYVQTWALALAATLLAAVAYGIYRLRLGVLLRLERQRTRIAMDLHDEMGSALGSIGILSGVLAEQELDRAERARLAGKIAETAGELGTALSDIVWSLDAGPHTLEDLAGRLAEHGSRLFSTEEVRFDVKLTDPIPRRSLAFPVFRAVLLIGLEAMHNAARHARARRVLLAIDADGRDAWRLTVEDDGRGLVVGAAEAGVGMSSMRRRAKEIGAVVEWSRPPAGGTRVTLRFSPRRSVT